MYKITKTTVRNYYVTFCRPFMEFSKFKEARGGMRHTPSTCFGCGWKFKDEDMLYLGAVKNQLNQVFCEECGKQIIESLENERNDSGLCPSCHKSVLDSDGCCSYCGWGRK